MPASGMGTPFFLRLSALLLCPGMPAAPASASQPLELEVDLLEVHLGKGPDHLLLDSTLTIGEGENTFLAKIAGGSETRTSFDDVEAQALYSHALSATAALHLGIRHDMRPGSDLSHAVAGVVVDLLPGLEAEHYFFVSRRGDVTGGGQLLLGVDLAPRLVLEPRLGFSWSAQRVPVEDLGHGLTDIEASVRLRRSLSETFNVYTGVVHERLLGSTRAIAVEAGDPSRVTRAIMGIGFTF